MLTTTKAIFLHTTRLSGNKVVIHLYTKDFGRVSIVANNLHRKNSDLKMSLLTPFSLFNLTFNFQEKKDLHRYEELVPYYIFQQIPFSPIRSALSLFMTEIVYRSIKERQTDESLFSFLEKSIIYLDEIDDCNKELALFHFLFLAGFSKELGFFPRIETYEEGSFFDLEEGAFYKNVSLNGRLLNANDSFLFYSILSAIDKNELNKLSFSRETKQLILYHFIEYFSIHIAGFSRLKSLDILIQLFD